MEKLFDGQRFAKYIERVVTHYEKSAPAVANWADELYILFCSRGGEHRVSVRDVFFLQQQQLQAETGSGFVDGNLAQNQLLHHLQDAGCSTEYLIDH